MEKEISRATLKRLPTYLSYLKALPSEASANISATALAAVGGADERIVGVECGDDVESVFGKPAIAQKRPTELARADQYGIVAVAVAKEVFNIRNQVFAVVADFRSAPV